MDFPGARVFQHLYEMFHGGAPDNRVVYQDDAFSGNGRLQYAEFHMYAVLPLFLGRLDKCSADIGIFIKSKAEGDARGFRIAFGGRQSRFRNAGHQVCCHGVRFCQRFSCSDTGVVNADSVYTAVQSRKIDVFKNTMGAFFLLKGIIGFYSFCRDGNQFPRLDVPDECRTRGGKGAAFRSQHISVAAFSQAKGLQSEGIP